MKKTDVEWSQLIPVQVTNTNNTNNNETFLQTIQKNSADSTALTVLLEYDYKNNTKIDTKSTLLT